MSDLSEMTSATLEEVVRAFDSAIKDADSAESNHWITYAAWEAVDGALSEGKAKYTAELARRNLK